MWPPGPRVGGVGISTPELTVQGPETRESRAQGYNFKEF